MAYKICECAAVTAARQEVSDLRKMVWLLYSYADLPGDTMLTQADRELVDAAAVVWSEEEASRRIQVILRGD
jgi:hypothetical protein